MAKISCSISFSDYLKYFTDLESIYIYIFFCKPKSITEKMLHILESRFSQTLMFTMKVKKRKKNVYIKLIEISNKNNNKLLYKL